MQESERGGRAGRNKSINKRIQVQEAVSHGVAKHQMKRRKKEGKGWKKVRNVKKNEERR